MKMERRQLKLTDSVYPNRSPVTSQNGGIGSRPVSLTLLRPSPFAVDAGSAGECRSRGAGGELKVPRAEARGASSDQEAARESQRQSFRTYSGGIESNIQLLQFHREVGGMVLSSFSCARGVFRAI